MPATRSKISCLISGSSPDASYSMAKGKGVTTNALVNN